MEHELHSFAIRMPVVSPENALIFSVFQFLLAGLSVAASGWLLFEQKARPPTSSVFLLLGFGLLALHYLGNSHLYFLELSNQADFFTFVSALWIIRNAHIAGFVLIAVAALRLKALVLPLVLLVGSVLVEGQWWIASMLLAVMGLLGSAFAVEKRCESIYFRFFVRLNTVFVAIALALILITTYSERGQHLEYAALSVDDLTEYLRGHIIYYHQNGVAPAEILTNPEIQRRIISEFGRVPDLRKVRVGVKDHCIEMLIRDDGAIDYSEKALPLAPLAAEDRYNRQEKLLNLVSVPVVFNNEKLGLIEMDQTLTRINARLSRQIQVVFIGFTVAVFAAFLVSGLILREANRTIQKQCSQLREVESQLMQASKLASIGQLADGIAHEINNPAGIILSRADYLAAVASDNGMTAQIGGDVDVIRRQAWRISSIVSDLLMFSRPSRLTIQSIDVVEVLSRSVQFLRPDIDARGICICTAWPPHPVMLLADGDRLEQVVINIIQNALDAMPRGGCIDIAASEDREGVTLRFKDSGVGIEPKNLERIFDPFFTTKGHKGTGLGLSISYGIVRDHGGKISVESSPGQGTAFAVFLPRAGGRS